mmetsp:Transcript_2913/g.4715  ORF Transcript_2913/g.4715 Transcript_2913/m.4715 type:complete len:353 (-) Transcript_2913:1192-2250(-)|eukprot:CAMPEP_0119008188 /NCGR_PEP_ID=MMETSP1176-20130426/3523_1 /TAXON_ID=265551 /ORGANISM="Synedropsis recta cf, Strain CCMP1620" /LENGTH=352 /DNA_ID=CAMNT_0006960473 /DNA_START=42 /DNA_END=1100 /DNA_ORIENTATION=+
MTRKTETVVDTRMSSNKPSVLVVLATGKMGTGICDAFLATNKFRVFGTSRNPQHPSLISRDITPIEFQFGNKDSMVRALQVSDATVVVVITELLTIAKTREKEILHGSLMIDACKQVGTPHVIFCSNNFADSAPENANHLKSKLHIERYLKAAGLDCYSILRPVSFFENWDDTVTFNPLKRGILADLYPGDVTVPLVAALDIGKAAVAMANDSSRWAGRTLDCVTYGGTGIENAKILSAVSGVSCRYKQAMPSFVLWLILQDLSHMVDYVAKGMQGWNIDEKIEDFKKVVPDAMGPHEWFTAKGQWADGSRFTEPPPQRTQLTLLLPTVAVLGAIVAFVTSWYAYENSYTEN